MSYWNIFWRTFAQLATGVMAAALVVDWTTEWKASATTVGLGLLTALVGGLVAAGHAYVRTPAVSAVQKATRSLVQFVVAGAGVLAFNQVSDVIAVRNLAVPLAIGAVLSFALTFFQNQGAVEA